MKTAIILHGTLGSPDGNWFAWLKDTLEAQGMRVWLPQLPQAAQPSLREWANFVRNHCPFVIGGETLVIGHSSGAILSLVLAQQSKVPIGGVVAVSVFHDNSLQWEPNNRLFDIRFDWRKMQRQAQKLLFIHSDDDPYVPLEQATYVATHCQAEIVVIPKQGHFNLEKSHTYKAFPQLLEITCL